MDPIEPQWHTNSSFSPPLSRRWDLRLPQDVSLHGSLDAIACESSLSSHSKGSANQMILDQYSNHHHSVSDGALSYYESPSNNFKTPRWTPPVQRFDVMEFSTPTRGARPDGSAYSQSNERCFAAGLTSLSNSIGSGSPVSESGWWASTSKGHLPPRHSSSRRSFMSKPVYPIVFHNPVSGNEGIGVAETSGGSRSTLLENKASPTWTETDSSPELKFHKTLTELQIMEASPYPDASSRRQGFRWSNASSYDFGFEDGIDMSESISLENITSADLKCGLCGRLLCQKSPWSSCRVVRNSDMPIAGVLPCSHVFHADCLEEMTPKTHLHDPPCPVCAGAIGLHESISFSEPLQVALRAARKKQGTFSISEDAPMESNSEIDCDLKRNKSLQVARGGGGLLIKKHFKKHFSFKRSAGKDLFGSKILGRKGLPSSSSMLHANKKQVGCYKTGQSSN